MLLIPDRDPSVGGAEGHALAAAVVIAALRELVPIRRVPDTDRVPRARGRKYPAAVGTVSQRAGLPTAPVIEGADLPARRCVPLLDLVAPVEGDEGVVGARDDLIRGGAEVHVGYSIGMAAE